MEKHLEKVWLKLKKLEAVYCSYIFQKAAEIPMQYFETKEHFTNVPQESHNHSWEFAKQGTKWGEAWGYAWFTGRVSIPSSLTSQKLFIRAETGALEGLFWINSIPKGIFNHAREAANRGNHHTLLLSEKASKEMVYEIAIEGYAGHPIVGTQPYETFGDNPKEFIRSFESVDLMIMRDDVKDFVFDLRTLLQLFKASNVDAFRQGKIMNCLLEVYEGLIQSPEQVKEQEWRDVLSVARERMKPLLSSTNAPSIPKAGLIGHSHMDTAWLWTQEETIRKCARTYSNVISLMEQYPEYTFIQSSAYHLEMMRVYYPALFERIQQRISEGRWDPNGGSWIEPDCNLISGEALIRQFLRGISYTQEYFNYRADTFWLPDTFGYSAALPQILAGVGIKYFLTTKLTWNDTNTFPLDTFYWRGIDGSQILTHFNDIHCWPDPETLTSKIYGGGQTDFRTAKNFIQHKHVNDRRLIAYGYGDGGGGPQYEMLEAARRCEDLEGCPQAKHTNVRTFMEQLERESRHIPVYSGELYFEGHRGSLTQMHEIKRNNRKAEVTLRCLEIVEALVLVMDGNWNWHEKSKAKSLYDILLVNQFHDILPGTSIPEVHDRAILEVSSLVHQANKEIQSILDAAVIEDEAITVWNALSWERVTQFSLEQVEEGWVAAEDEVICQWINDLKGRKKFAVGGIVLPSFGAASIPLKKGKPYGLSSFQYNGVTLETPYATVRFDSHGYIDSFYDKSSERELRGSGRPLNSFLMGEDVPQDWDNWDIDADLQGKLRHQTNLIQRNVVADGPLQFRIRSEYEIGRNSTLLQDIVFYADQAKVDFETLINWKDPHHFLKVSFDVNLLSPTAKHEVQFGYVERPTHTNTPYDAAMFEVCAHKWSDLSENRFGISILNDCKYGISVMNSDMQLSLHKGGCHPDSRGDVGVHECTYSFLPHQGNFSVDQVVRPAYELNTPILMSQGNAKNLSQFLVQVSVSNVIAETIKLAETGNSLVFRFYEAERNATRTTVKLGFDCQRAVLTNLLEEELQNIPVINRQFELMLRPFEIVTVKVDL